MQPYLNKFPAELVALFPPLAAAAAEAGTAAPAGPPAAPPPTGVGAPYREAQVSPGTGWTAAVHGRSHSPRA